MTRAPHTLAPLSPLLVEEAVRAALREDLGRGGDVTSEAVVEPPARATARIVAREDGRLAGLDLALAAFRMMDPAVEIETGAHDGRDIRPGTVVASVSGLARPILAAERVALNYLGHLSGIATLTRAYVRAAGNHKARIVCTRKTTPGLRAFEKYAVRAGGGVNHRFGLDDGILIKDNHIAMAGGVAPALERARAHAGHMLRIEVEVDTLPQLEEALEAGADAVLLDNMDVPTLTKAVAMIGGRAVAEASGGVSLDTVAAIAATGVDLISVGRLTHSAPCLDIGLDFETAL